MHSLIEGAFLCYPQRIEFQKDIKSTYPLFSKKVSTILTIYPQLKITYPQIYLLSTKLYLLELRSTLKRGRINGVGYLQICYLFVEFC